MPDTRKYLFDRDFGPRPPPQPEAQAPVAVLVEEMPAAEPPAPMFTEDEINLARESAFDEGRRQGREEAARADEARVAQGLAAIAGALDDLVRRQEDANAEAARDAARVAYTAVRKVLPAACRVYAFEEVANVVEEVIGQVLDEPRIIVRVGPGLADLLRPRLEAVADGHGFEGRVVVQEDPRLPAGNCRVEWADGGAERDQARLLAEIDAAVERALLPADGSASAAEGSAAGARAAGATQLAGAPA